MRVLFLSTSMGMGGADKQLLSAAHEMHLRGYQVRIVSLTSLGPMGLEAQSLGIPTESLEMRRGVADPRGLMRLIGLTRQWKPDVLHAHGSKGNYYAAAYRIFAGAPTVMTAHSTVNAAYNTGSRIAS